MRLPPRPRDALGRPLARDSGVPLEPDPAPLPPREALDEAQRLLDAGRAFRAHEVLEATWKATTGDDRELWRGLAQLAVGVTHAQRGNIVGAARLLQRGARSIEPWAGRTPYDVDVDGLRTWARRTAEQPATVQPPRLRVAAGDG